MSALSVLCGMLDDSSDEDEQHKAPRREEEEEDGKEKVDEGSSGVEAAPAAGQGGEKEEDCEEEMEAQMRAMQERVRKMQEALERKRAQKAGGKVSRSSSSASEVDLFSAPSTSRAGAPRSPVRTDPFEDTNRHRLKAKRHLRTPRYGPALPEKTSRIIQGGEKERLLEEIIMRDKTTRDAELVRDDLAMDSSDEEDARNHPTEQKYNACGKELKRIAKTAPPDVRGQITSLSSTGKKEASKVGFNQVEGCTLNLSNAEGNKLLPKDFMLEKFSRLKVRSPVLSSASLEAHMLGKIFVAMSRLREAILRRETEGQDWTTIGVVYHKASQTSKKSGNTYTLWRMTDLQGDIRTITVMLFGRCHGSHYKIPLNRVVGILNPKVMEDRAGKGEVTLSVDHPDKILEIGDSLEVGKCQAKRKDGSGCTNLVNLGTCEYCAYHVKKAYQSVSSKRNDLQSTFSGTAGVRARIMGKIDPRGNIFAGGQSMNPVFGGGDGSGGRLNPDRPPAPSFTGSQKHRAKDDRALAALGVERVNRALETEERQKQALTVLQRSGKAMFTSHLSREEKDTVKNVAREVSTELGMRLLAPTPGARGLIKTLSKPPREEPKEEDKPKDAPEEVSARQLLLAHRKKLAEERARKVLFERQQKASLASSAPKLGRGLGSSEFIDLSSAPGQSRSVARAKALLAQKGKSALETRDPNYVPQRKRKANELECARKRVALALEVEAAGRGAQENRSDGSTKEAVPQTTSTGKVMTKERLAAICSARSKNEHLVSDFENETLERRLDALERKEAMEEKMVGTKELETRAVTCKECNYTSFSQSELCRGRGHRVRRIAAAKRFFECRDCKKRTVSLDRYPKSACDKCGGSSWARTGMMREKKGPALESERLLIRGAEQKFVGQTVSSEDLRL